MKNIHQQTSQNIRLDNFNNLFEMNIRDIEDNIYVLCIRINFTTKNIDIQLKYYTDIIDTFNEGDRIVKDVRKIVKNAFSVMASTFITVDNDLDLIGLSNRIDDGIRYTLNHVKDLNDIKFNKSIRVPLSVLTKAVAKYYLIKSYILKKDENKND